MDHCYLLGNPRERGAEPVLIRFAFLFLLTLSAYAETLTGYVWPLPMVTP